MPNNVWSGSQTFSAPSAEETVVVISAPVRGVLRAYTLFQADGTAAGFDANLYTSDQAPEEIYHLVDLVDQADNTDDVDVVAIVENNRIDIPYVNRKTTTANPVRELYLKITPTGSGTKAFTLSITVEAVSFR